MNHFDVSFTKEDIRRVWEQTEKKRQAELEKARQSMKPTLDLIELIYWVFVTPIIGWLISLVEIAV